MHSDSLGILESIPHYGSQALSLHGPIPCPPSYMITFTLPYSDIEFGDLMCLIFHTKIDENSYKHDWRLSKLKI